MATTSRQPFAPLNTSRLANLTSLKNRQNATLSPPSKRKATSFDADNFNNSENIDPIIFLSPKRSKHPDGGHKDTYQKPTNFFLARAPPSPNDFSSLKQQQQQQQQQQPVISRPILNPRPRLDTSSAKKSAPLSAPAGRSPTRKRVGILNRRKTAGAFTRIEPPKFSANGLGFSIDAALSGTIPSYSSHQPSISTSVPMSKESLASIPLLHTPKEKDSWFFDIHEDTEEELATNLMEHGACTLDISSDEESKVRERDERGKENVPPMDDVSQTRTQLTSSASSGVGMDMGEIKARVRGAMSRRREEEGAIEIDRSPLGDLVKEDFYAEGCDEGSVFLVEDEDHEEEAHEQPVEEEVPSFDVIADIKGKGKELELDALLSQPQFDIDALMSRDAMNAAPKAALLLPIEKPEEGPNFEVWESGSAKGDE